MLVMLLSGRGTCDLGWLFDDEEVQLQPDAIVPHERDFSPTSDREAELLIGFAS